MKHLFFLAMLVTCVALTLWFTGCGKEESVSTYPVTQEFARGVTTAGLDGTMIVSQSMDINCTNYFKWTFTQSMDQIPDSLCEGECNDLEVAVTAKKGDQVTGFSGHICIRNAGEFPTENLAITVKVMKSCAEGEFIVVRDSVSISASLKPILGAGESYCYGYAVNVARFGGIDPNCMYKIVANVTITNYLEQLGTPYGIQPESPAMQGCPPSNDCVEVTDVPGTIIPADAEVLITGWNITASPSMLEFCESGTAMFVLHVCNNGVSAEETFTAENKLLVGSQFVDTANYYLTTLGCTPQGGGCTRTIGFYKTHAVSRMCGRNPDMVSAYLPIYLGTPMGPKTLVVTKNTQVVSIMKREGPGGSSNGILKLYAQLLAAKLNIAGANGSGMPSDGSCIAAAIADADAFLATYNAKDWSSLSRDQKRLVLEWMNTFDRYNNGLMCAPHCGNDRKHHRHKR